MSDGGEKSCPLCAEEMDLTDQQLKPCKCGYEICVWCWHHIMNMAEKDATVGRCPACRTPYNKEKIVGTAAKCERLVSEVNVEKKIKSQKGKGKTLEGKKQLESVRVIQRNLAYVVGLPLDFADEELLQRREYFAKYGKVLKVSISRTTTGAIQQFANSTCSVYITYSNEEEAVRCIQSVHGFALDGRSLKACFGTTKYCHSWLRNMPCTNQDCLYLHETGSQDDSFTKDEIISAYTRSRVQYITTSSNSMQRRSGSVLPPPADEYYSNSPVSSVKPIAKSAINANQNSTIGAKVSPPSSSSGRSTALPAGALWGTRPSSNNQVLAASNPHLNATPNQKPDLYNDTGKKKSLHNEENPISREKTEMGTFDLKEMESNIDGSDTISNGSVASVHVSLPSSRQPHSPPTTSTAQDSSDIVDSSLLSSGLQSEKDSTVNHRDGNVENKCSGISSLSIHEDQQVQKDNVDIIRKDQQVQKDSVDIIRKVANTANDVCIASVQSDYGLTAQNKLTQVYWREREDDMLSFDNQRINDPEIDTSRVPEFSSVLNLSNCSNIHSAEFNNADGSLGIGFDRHLVDRNYGKSSKFHNGHPEDALNNFESGGALDFDLFPTKERHVVGRYEGEAASGAVDMGESNIISKIFSLDFNPWGDEPLTSPQNMSKFLGDTDKRQESYRLPGLLKSHNSNQSRFSFAREMEPVGHVSGFGESAYHYEQGFKQHPFSHAISSSNGFYHERSVSHNGLTDFSGTGQDSFAGSHSHISSNMHSASRSRISAPPGFSVPSRAAPPPGFSSLERADQVFEPLPGNHILDPSSSLLRNQYQTAPNSTAFSNDDIEFIDPAILAVGKGSLPVINNHNPGLDIRSTFSQQLSSYENSELQSLLPRSLPPYQNQRFTDMGGSFLASGSAYGIPSQIMDQTLSNNLPLYSQFNLAQSRNGITSNGQWNGWSENNVEYNKLYGGYEDSKIRNPGSGNIYNRTYGI